MNITVSRKVDMILAHRGKYGTSDIDIVPARVSCRPYTDPETRKVDKPARIHFFYFLGTSSKSSYNYFQYSLRAPIPICSYCQIDRKKVRECPKPQKSKK